MKYNQPKLFLCHKIIIMFCIDDETKIRNIFNEYLNLNVIKLMQWMGNEANTILTNNGIKFIFLLK